MRRQYSKMQSRSTGLASRRLDNLSHTVNDLFQKAVTNEKIFRKYQQFELKLLGLSDLENLLAMLLRNSIDYFQLDSVELWLYDPQSILDELLAEESKQLGSLRLLPRNDQLQQLYGRRPEVRLVSLTEHDDLPIFSGKKIRSAALLPLVRDGLLVGSWHFGASGNQRYALNKATDFIAHLASITSVCLENTVNRERLQRLSLYDSLTKVKNRRAFHLSLEQEVSRAARSGDPLSLLFVDLDHFKQVNDTYGHPMGDTVLRVVAQQFAEILRKTDHVCRYGGEEFALVLPNCSEQRAREIAERIRAEIAALEIDDDCAEPGLPKVSVTLSIGVCCWSPANDQQEGREQEIVRELLACSDQGVYQSKAAGRNCVHYVPLADEGPLEGV